MGIYEDTLITTSHGSITIAHKCPNCSAVYSRYLRDDEVCTNCALIKWNKVAQKERRDAWVAFAASNGVKQANILLNAYDAKWPPDR